MRGAKVVKFDFINKKPSKRKAFFYYKVKKQILNQNIHEAKLSTHLTPCFFFIIDQNVAEMTKKN